MIVRELVNTTEQFSSSDVELFGPGDKCALSVRPLFVELLSMSATFTFSFMFRLDESSSASF